jgi:hypothetical protein
MVEFLLLVFLSGVIVQARGYCFCRVVAGEAAGSGIRYSQMTRCLRSAWRAAMKSLVEGLYEHHGSDASLGPHVAIRLTLGSPWTAEMMMMGEWRRPRGMKGAAILN